MNAVIRAVVKTATRIGWSVLGIEDGFEGLLGKPRTRRLTFDEVRGLLPRGGSILGCTNCGHFGLRLENGKAVKNEAAFEEALRNFEHLSLDGLVVIGGDGSQRIAYELFRMGIPVVGVPKTIDNDLAETDLTFGFDTALEIATEAIDRLHTTAESHGRVMLVEVMGRHVGWIALLSGIAGGADVILIPEIPFYIERIAAKVNQREASGRKFSVMVVAEGSHPADADLVYREAPAAFSEGRLGGIAERVAHQLSAATGKETRVVVLGHIQRGGPPTPFDRVLASACGAAAVHAIANGKFGHLAAWKNNEVVTVPLELATKTLKRIPPTHHLVQVARDLGISFAGLEDEDT
jgi:6-phosphofructokinase 1